ncbi:MAG TPA: T9SS type A sorting domain-containing protein [Panacibacter sp.]|nr:T9SS type A sorting domain-containing protein [Panacibacter sp.]
MKKKLTLAFLLFSCLLITKFKVQAQAVNVQDSLALVDLFNSTDGPNWRYNDNWLKGPVNTWRGVIVLNNRVWRLLLPDFKLNGKIPYSIGNLTGLDILQLATNNLSDTVPSSIGNLTNLKSLELQYNNLTGSLPVSLSKLTKLTFLAFFTNKITGNIPPELSALKNLSTLSLGLNQLTGTIPPELGSLTNLYKLQLSNNHLSGQIPPELGNLQRLGALELGNNNLTGNIPPELGNISNMDLLWLDHNHLRGNIPTSFENFPKIRSLNLKGNEFSGDVSFLVNIPTLIEVHLNQNRFLFDGMELIQQNILFPAYNQQAHISIHQNGNSLSVTAGGNLANNTYAWFLEGEKDTTFINGDSVFHPSKNGIYNVIVKNSVATKLILKSKPINYIAPSYINAASAYDNNQQQSIKKNTSFFVYPNPAKDILHIETDKNVTVSLINEEGKVLITKNINDKGEINVASFPAGLYYIKNNSNGEVQKIIIHK